MATNTPDRRSGERGRAGDAGRTGEADRAGKIGRTGTLLFKRFTVVRPERVETDTDVLVENGVISNIAPGLNVQADEVVQGRGRYLTPGFIDLHIHGARDRLVDNGPDDLTELCRLLPRYGVTGYLPTVVPQPPEEHIELVGSLASREYEGTKVYGFFLEGPFLKLTGALPDEALGNLTAKRITDLRKAAYPYRAIFAVAPDVEGAIELIPYMAEKSEATKYASSASREPVFITHTQAGVEQTLAGIRAGISHATHFYDVFPAPEEYERGARPVGAVEVILADPSVTVDFILDGEHVEPVAARMALRVKGPEGVSLVTDANLGAGLPPGRYIGLNNSEVEFAYEGAPARMTESSPKAGGLAGSGLTMDRAVRNAMSLLDVPLHQAVRMASLNPASVLGIADQVGAIDVGMKADLVILDTDYSVRATYVEGRACFEYQQEETS